MIFNRKRLLYIVPVIIALVALILLSAGIPRIELRPATFFYSDDQPAPQPKSIPDMGRPPQEIFISNTLLLILVLAPVLALILLVIFVPGARRYTIRNVFIILIWAATVYYLYSIDSEEASNVQKAYPGAIAAEPITLNMPDIPRAPLPEITSSTPNWLVFIISFIVIAVLLITAYIIYRRFFAPSDDEEELDMLVSEARSALEDIKSGLDLHNAILRCYAEMSKILSSEKGIHRKHWMTPREFEVRLVSAGLPKQPVITLTRLFETVRYGAHEPDNIQETQAVECLTAIVQTSRKKP